jgi:hypothetical protein
VDQSTVRQLHAQGAPVAGTLKAVDADKHTATVDETTYAVARDAYVVIDGKRGTLAALPAGSVNLVLTVDQKTIRGIHATLP